MQKIVIDTNVIISAALSNQGNPAEIISLVLDKAFEVYYNQHIINEYTEVLSRPKFKLQPEKQEYYIEEIKQIGILFTPVKSEISLPDESDRIFYDTAKESGAILITGNKKHYPNEDFIMNPFEFLQQM